MSKKKRKNIVDSRTTRENQDTKTYRDITYDNDNRSFSKSKTNHVIKNEVLERQIHTKQFIDQVEQYIRNRDSESNNLVLVDVYKTIKLNYEKNSQQ